MKALKTKLRQWLMDKYIKFGLWIFDGTYCRVLSQSTFVTMEARHYRSNNLEVVPSHMTFKRDDTLIVLGWNRDREEA